MTALSVWIGAAGAMAIEHGLVESDLGLGGWISLRDAGSSWASTLSILAVGLSLGLKHALDADHLAAVSTIVADQKGIWRSSLVGVLWGIGHTLALLIAAVAVVLLHVEISPLTAQGLELIVAVMLIWLGTSAIWKILRGGHVHLHVHEHGARRHAHPHVHVPERAADIGPHTHHGVRFSVQPLIVGMIHGLAGSAALMLLVLTTIPSPQVGFLYIGVFGLGSIGGMVVMSVLVSLPLQMTAERFTLAHTTLRTLAALLSVGLGTMMVYEIGIVGGFLV